MNKIVMLICFIFLLGCENETVEKSPSNSEDIKLVNNMLIFNSQATLNNVLNHKKEITQKNFISQRDIFEKIINAESKNISYIDSLSQCGISNYNLHSEEYEQYLKEKFIKIVKYNDGTECYDLNSYAPYLARIVNQEGFFAINDTIYQITPTSIKIWKGGNIMDYKRLSRFETTSIKDNIFIITDNIIETRTTFPFQYVNQTVGIQRYALKANPNGSADVVEDNRYRYMAIFYDKTTPVFATASYMRESYVRIIGQEKIGNTNSYNYMSFNYSLEFGADVIIKNEKKNLTGTFNNIGQDDWFTIYFPYLMMVQSKDGPISSSDDYIELQRIYLKLSPPAYDQYHATLLILNGQKNPGGAFYYEYSYATTPVTQIPL